VQDHKLYRLILGIEAPWFVDSVDLKLEVGEIHVYLRHDERNDWPCPECGRVEGWRCDSVGTAYPLLPVSFGSASRALP